MPGLEESIAMGALPLGARWRAVASAAFITVGFGAQAQDGAATSAPPAASAPPVTQLLKMPPVTPEQGILALAGRHVPPSDVPGTLRPMTMGRMATAPAALNVAPVLGHELPTNAKTKDGLPRADFAVAPATQSPGPTAAVPNTIAP